MPGPRRWDGLHPYCPMAGAAAQVFFGERRGVSPTRKLSLRRASGRKPDVEGRRCTKVSTSGLRPDARQDKQGDRFAVPKTESPIHDFRAAKSLLRLSL